MKRYSLIALILFAAIIITESVQAREKNIVKIALLHTFSIPDPMCYDPYGKSLDNAVNMAWEDFKRNNRNIDFNVQFLRYDFGGNKLKVPGVVDDALKDGCLAGIGFTCSDYALLGGARAQTAKLPLITPTSTADKIAEIGNYVFMASFANAQQGQALSSFAFVDLNKRQTLIIAASDCSYCLTLSEAYSSSFKQQGGEISGEIHILTTDTEFTELVNKIRHYSFDSIFLPNYAAQSASIIATLLKNGVKTIFMGGDAWNWTEMSFAIVGNKSFRGYMVTSWAQDFPDPVSKNFVRRYNNRFGEITSIVPAHSYDSAMLMFNAIKTANKHTRNDIKDALSHIKNYKGVTGSFTYNQNQRPEKSVAIVELSNNEQKIIKTIKP
ncbi:MAG: ABC transporter substrate-binding protein [Desulfobacteraceae bacterium]|jgi:branched-chain amino acid transport system substrate-binding protein